MSWKKYGGTNKLEKFNNLSVSTIVTDQFTLRNIYVGDWDICGGLRARDDVNFGRDLNVIGTVTCGNINILGTLGVLDTRIVGNLTVDSNVFIGQNLFMGADNSAGTLLHASNEMFGFNVYDPEATVDISSGLTKSLYIQSSAATNKNVIAQNATHDAITVNVETTRAYVDFYVDGSLNDNNSPDGRLLYEQGGNFTIDVSNTLKIKPRTIFSQDLNKDFLGDERLIVYSEEATAAYFVAPDNTSTVDLRLATEQGRGLSITGGYFLNNRIVGTLALTDVNTEYQALNIISGNLTTNLKTSIAVNKATVSTTPEGTNLYAMDINGPIRLVHEESINVLDTSFEIMRTEFNGNVGFAVGGPSSSNRQFFSKTTNGGYTWTTQRLVDEAGNPNPNSLENTPHTFTSIFVQSSGNVYIAGDSGYFYNSTNGGQNWSTVTYNNPNNYAIQANALHVTSPSNRLIIGVDNAAGIGNGKILNSTTFNDISTASFVTTGLMRVKAIHGTSDDVVIAGQGGLIMYRTTTNTFNGSVVATDASFNSVKVYNNSRAVAVGNNVIYYTNNIAWPTATWIQVSPAFTGILQSVQILDAARAIAVGDAGLVAYSTDGFATWTKITTDPLLDLTNISILNANDFVLTGTTAGGESRIINLYAPYLLNRPKNHVIEASGNIVVSGDLQVNDLGQILSNNEKFNVFPTTVKEVNIGNTSVGGNTNVKANLDVTLDITGNQRLFVLQDSSLNGNLMVMKDTSLNQRLFVQQDASLNSNLTVMKDTSLNQRLFVRQDASLNSNLTVMKDTSLNQRLFVLQDASLNSNLTVMKDTSLNMRLFVQQDASLNSNLTVMKDTSLNMRLFVQQDASLNSNLTVMKDTSLNMRLFVQQDASLNSNLTVMKDTSLNMRLFVQQDASFNSNITVMKDTSLNQRLFVQQDTSLNSNLTVMKDTSLNMRLFVQQDASFNSNITVLKDTSLNQRLFVLGDASLNSNLTVIKDTSLNQRLFVQQDASLNSNLSVVKDTSLNQRLFVGGDVSFNSNLSVIKDTSLNQRLYVGGDVSLNSNLTVIKDTSLNQRLFVQGDVSLNSNLRVIKDTSLNGLLYVGGDVSLNSNLTVIKDTSLNGRLYVQQDVSLNSNLTVIKDTSLNGFLYVGGDVSLNSNLRVIKDTSLNQRLFVGGDVSFNSNLTVIKDTSLNQRLYVGGDVSFNSNLRVIKDSSLNGLLYVGGDVSFNSNLSVIKDSSLNQRLYVGGDVSLNSNLRVIKDTSLNQRLFVGGDVSLNSNLTVIKDTSLNQRLFVQQDVSLNSNLTVMKDTSLNMRLFVGGSTKVVDLSGQTADFSTMLRTNVIDSLPGSGTLTIGGTNAGNVTIKSASGSTNYLFLGDANSNVQISGNLFLPGSITTVNTSINNLEIKNKTILLNDEATGTNVSGFSGLMFRDNNVNNQGHFLMNGTTDGFVFKSSFSPNRVNLDVSGLTLSNGLTQGFVVLKPNAIMGVSADYTVTTALVGIKDIQQLDASLNRRVERNPTTTTATTQVVDTKILATGLYVNKPVDSYITNAHMDIAGNAFITKLGLGTNSVNTSYTLDVAGNTKVSTNVDVSGSLSVQTNINSYGTIIQW